MNNTNRVSSVVASVTDESALPQGLLNEAQIDLIGAPTPPEYIKSRKGSGSTVLNYVEVSFVIQQLNLLFGYSWDFTIQKEIITDLEVVVRGSIIVRSTSGLQIVKTQYGCASVKKFKESGKSISIGDDLKAAGSDSLKKCNSLLGLSMDVYSGNIDTDRKESSHGDNSHIKARDMIEKIKFTRTLDQLKKVWTEYNHIIALYSREAKCQVIKAKNEQLYKLGNIA